MFSQPKLDKLIGKPKDFQLIESLLRMHQLLSLATDILSSLIHNSKVKNGSKVKKEVK
jgi:hypothetical protein